MQSVITYFTGGASYSVPFELTFTYLLTLLRFLFFGFVINYYFGTPYSVLTMSLSVLLADFRFFVDFSEYMDIVTNLDVEDDNYEDK